MVEYQRSDTHGKNLVLATYYRLVVVDGAVDHNLTPFQLLPNVRLCRDRRGEGSARP